MKKNIREIYHAFNGKLVGTDKMKQYVCEVVSLMEYEIVNYVTANCWFVGAMDDSLGFTFTGNDLKDQHLIFLSDELFEHDEEQIRYTIAHEIGHVILGHRNSIIERQSKAEIYSQETEADEFAREYIKD